MLSNHVGEHIDIHLSVEINARIDLQVTGGPEVSIQSVLDQIEKYKHLRARIGKAAAASYIIYPSIYPIHLRYTFPRLWAGRRGVG